MPIPLFDEAGHRLLYDRQKLSDGRFFLLDRRLLECKIIQERNEKEDKPMIIEGIAGKAGMINDNDRLYPVLIYENAVNNAQPYIVSGEFLGEVDHPAWGYGSLSRSAIKFTKLWMDNDLMRFIGEVLDTEDGIKLEKLIRRGVGIRISTRGAGSVDYRTDRETGREIEVILDDYELYGIDAVLRGANQYGRINKHESLNLKNERSGIPMALTLSELKEKYPDVATAHKAEILENINSEIKGNLEEARESGRKEVLESEEYKKAVSFMESVKKVVTPVFGLEKSDEDLKVELEALKESYGKTNADFQAVKAEAEKYKKIVTEQEKKAKRDLAIEEATKDYAHKDMLKEQLSECETADAVQSRLPKAKLFIEKFFTMNPGAIPTGNGINENLEQEDIKPVNRDSNDHKEEQKYLARD